MTTIAWLKTNKALQETPYVVKHKSE